LNLGQSHRAATGFHFPEVITAAGDNLVVYAVVERQQFGDSASQVDHRHRRRVLILSSRMVARNHFTEARVIAVWLDSYGARFHT